MDPKPLLINRPQKKHSPLTLYQQPLKALVLKLGILAKLSQAQPRPSWPAMPSQAVLSKGKPSLAKRCSARLWPVLWFACSAQTALTGRHQA